MYQDIVEIILNHPIKYKDQEGVAQESTRLVCSAPAVKHRKDTLFLTQRITQAYMNMGKRFSGGNLQELRQVQEDAPSEDSSNAIDGTGIILVLYSDEEDFYQFQERFKQFICGSGYSEIIKINGEIAFTSTHYDSLVNEDLEILIGGYAENFLLSSVLKNSLKS